MAPSSASDRAPSRAYAAPATQIPRNSGTDGRCAATSPGVRRIPIPMVLPMTMARPKATPSTRSRLPLVRCGGWGDAPCDVVVEELIVATIRPSVEFP
jgi:hypothetical protein